MNPAGMAGRQERSEKAALFMCGFEGTETLMERIVDTGNHQRAWERVVSFWAKAQERVLDMRNWLPGGIYGRRLPGLFVHFSGISYGRQIASELGQRHAWGDQRAAW